MRFSIAAYNLILAEEGWDSPELKVGGASGRTLPFGFDLRFCTPAYLRKCWDWYLEEECLVLLEQACGKKEDDPSIPDLSSVAFDHGDPDDVAAAVKVLKKFTLPEYAEQTVRFYPKSGLLPADGFGALVSMVYNRGGVQPGDHGIEERAIRDILASWNGGMDGLRQVAEQCAQQLRSMSRIWPHQHGLRLRREHEAELMERCLAAGANRTFDTDAEPSWDPAAQAV